MVHSAHGIGVFEGIHKLEMNGIVKDYIKVRYAKNDTLYVPVTQLDLVSKYIGPREDAAVKTPPPRGTEWQKAENQGPCRRKGHRQGAYPALCGTYAPKKGFAFPPDGEWQHDFESHFEFEETEDQLRCINEIKDDMERDVPMDRLLCGDVGFGKTEVALRAAFKCITSGKQCALLVPHHNSGMAALPNDSEAHGRIPSRCGASLPVSQPKQQDEILRKIKRGSIDIVVGTHRLV